MSRSWVFREVAAGNFPRPIKIGGASRWDSAQIEAYIATLLDACGA
jgi:predicted DNA-binding transcriptional regulator AlpA